MIYFKYLLFFVIALGVLQLILWFVANVLPKLVWDIQDLYRAWGHHIPALRQGPNRRLSTSEWRELGIKLGKTPRSGPCSLCDDTRITPEGDDCPYCVR